MGGSGEEIPLQRVRVGWWTKGNEVWTENTRWLKNIKGRLVKVTHKDLKKQKRTNKENWKSQFATCDGGKKKKKKKRELELELSLPLCVIMSWWLMIWFHVALVWMVWALPLLNHVGKAFLFAFALFGFLVMFGFGEVRKRNQTSSYLCCCFAAMGCFISVQMLTDKVQVDDRPRPPCLMSPI